MEINYENYNVHDLRRHASQIGVKNACKLRKEQLVLSIKDIEEGRVKPYVPPKPGRPKMGTIKQIRMVTIDERLIILEQQLENINKMQKFLITSLFGANISKVVKSMLTKPRDVLMVTKKLLESQEITKKDDE